MYVATLSGKKLSQLREQYTFYPAIPETNFKVEDKDGALKRLAEAYKDKPQSTLDGLTVTINDSTWFNVRPSNTESVMRLNAEAGSQKDLEELVANVTRLIENQ
jgi:phosphomannomutase